MKRNPAKLLLNLAILVAFLLFPGCIYAVSVTTTNSPAIINQDPFNVSISISGAQDGTNYLRIDLFKEGTQEYFGETDNGSEWYKGSDGKKYYAVTIVDSTASAILRGRVENPLPSEYVGPGIYKMRVRRYTTSGGPASGDVQTPVNIEIQISLPDPSPSPTSTPTSTPSPTPTPTPSPTATPAKTPTLTPKKTPTPEPINEGMVEGTSSAIDIFGLRNSLNSPSPTPEGEDSPKPKTPILAFIFIGLGIILFGISGFTLYKGRKGNYNGTSDTGNEKIL